MSQGGGAVGFRWILTSFEIAPVLFSLETEVKNLLVGFHDLARI